MAPFFCAEESRQACEDPIGNGVFYDNYILIECPPPWAPQALDSKPIPANLTTLKAELSESLPSTRILLIDNPNLKQPNSIRWMLLQRQTGFSAGYDQREFEVSSLDEIAPALKTHLSNLASNSGSYLPLSTPPIRNILVCTHGSNDQCCARFGNPFYRQAVNLVSELGLDSVRIWQSSHFSGHRFAPTIIDFPEGRYYGRLDVHSFQTLLTRTGDLDSFKDSFKNMYRGWGILPDPAQVLERELIFQYGWDWFNYRVNYCILDQTEDERWSQVEITFQAPDGSTGGYRAEVVDDPKRGIPLRGECSSSDVDLFPQFAVKNLFKLDKLNHLGQIDG